MDWTEGLNGVVEYIEENLTNPIEYESLSRIVGCSVSEFSRLFSYIANMSVSEYIRRRRLSEAAFDIQNSGGKIIDIAVKYCYESGAAFTRAFKEMYGVTPLVARKTKLLLRTTKTLSFTKKINYGGNQNGGNCEVLCAKAPLCPLCGQKVRG